MLNWIGGAVNYSNFFYINLYDELIKNSYELVQEPLFSITSQLTGSTKNFLPFTMDSTNYERYYKFEIKNVPTEIPPIFYPVTGCIRLGDSDFPFGLYDVKIYQNDPGYPSNVDPTASHVLKQLYTGLLNVKAGVAPTTYTEYTTNDSDTESVYITI